MIIKHPLKYKIKKLSLLLLYSFLSYVVYTYFANKNHYSLPSRKKLNFIEFEKYNKGTVGVYFINLDRSVERKKSFESEIKGIAFPLQRIVGIDGKELSNQEIDKVFDYKAFIANTPEVPSKGVVGCYMSHMKTLRTFLESSYEYALIFEDDAKIPDIELLNRLISELITTKYNTLWDRVGFGRANTYGKLDKHLLKKITAIEKCNVSLYQSVAYFCSMHAYLINRKAAHILLEYSIPMKISAEFYAENSFNDKFSNLYTDKIIHKNKSFKSDIVSSKSTQTKQEDRKNRIKRPSLSNVIYFIQLFYKNAKNSLNNYKKITDKES